MQENKENNYKLETIRFKLWTWQNLNFPAKEKLEYPQLFTSIFKIQTLTTELHKQLHSIELYSSNLTVQLMSGIMEEVGEANHSILKMEQGIRGSKEEHLADLKDAIGDISIYTLNLKSSVYFSLNLDKEFDVYRKQAIDLAISDLLDELNALASLCGWNYVDLVIEVADTVMGRDWINNKKNGVK